MSVQKNKTGVVTGADNWWLRLEGLAFLFVTRKCFYASAFRVMPWYAPIAFFFIPDLSLLGYLISKKVGDLCHNIMYSYATPIIIFYSVSFLAQAIIGTEYNFLPADWNELSVLYFMLTFIPMWIARIALGRALGFGFKNVEKSNCVVMKTISKIISK